MGNFIVIVEKQLTIAPRQRHTAIFIGKMALSMVVALVTVPGFVGTQEAIRQGQSKEK